MNIALIIAGGVGQRMNMSTPKQFIEVNSKPIIIYTLEAFQNNKNIDEIAVVCLESWVDELKQWAKQYEITKLTSIVTGGSTGMESLRNGMLTLKSKYKDDDIIVINKPRGVVMYPSAGNKTGTLVQNILSHTHLSALGGETRPGVVHRLDKDTSGVMVFAKSDAAYRGLVKMFSAHDLTRKYIAFVWGVPNWEVADITGNIARSSRNRQKMTMVKSGGR